MAWLIYESVTLAKKKKSYLEEQEKNKENANDAGGSFSKDFNLVPILYASDRVDSERWWHTDHQKDSAQGWNERERERVEMNISSGSGFLSNPGTRLATIWTYTT